MVFAIKAHGRDPKAKTFDFVAQRTMYGGKQHLTDWNDGKPGTELNFKFYRQATNKIVGLSDSAAAFLASFFVRP